MDQSNSFSAAALVSSSANAERGRSDSRSTTQLNEAPAVAYPTERTRESSSIPRRSRGRNSRRLSDQKPADFPLNFQSYGEASRANTGSRFHSPVRVNSRVSHGNRQAPQFRRREQFVWANYRFAISPDVRINVRDAAAFVDWEKVDLVFVLSGLENAGECPICLYPYVTPKITRCGHLFCNICILQHLSFAENWVKSCPLCSALVSKSDLKSVDIRKVRPCELGTIQKLQLVKHEKNSIICIPSFQDSFWLDVLPEVTDSRAFFSRLVTAGNDYLLDILLREAKELKHAVQRDAGLAEVVDIALWDVCTRKADVQRRKRRTRRESAAQGKSANGKRGGGRTLCHSYDGGSLSMDSPAIGSRISGGSSRDMSNTCDEKGKVGSNCKYLYQMIDSQMFFAHPINIRMILRECGQLEKAFPVLEGKVLGIERLTMNSEVRRRYRFMSHVPDGCEFAFLELDLSSVLSEDTVKTFADELKSRAAARKRQARATKRENRELRKKQNELLRRHVEEQLGSRALQREEVDSNDPMVFPSLGNEAALMKRSIAPRAPGSAWGGAEISSYASITNNMGLFPELSAATSAASSGHQNSLRGSTGLEASMGVSRKTSNEMANAKEARYGENAEQRSSQTWTRFFKKSAEANPRQCSRRGKKPVVLFSNAGGPRRH